MNRRFVLISSIVFAVLINSIAALAQRDRFITVDGPSLKARMEAATRQAKSSSQATPYWTAYSFDVRPGVAVDATFTEFNGQTTTFFDTSIAIGTTRGVPAETRNLGVFLLNDPSTGSITRLEVYNLDRTREYSGYPVYWLGRASNDESLSLLQQQAESNQGQKITEKAVLAIGLHDDRRVGGILKNFVRSSTQEPVRGASIFWLGQMGGESSFLSDFARNEQESVKLRKKAVFAIGVGKDANAISALKSVYASTTNREVKKQIVFAASINESGNDGKEGLEFVIKAAESEPDAEVKKQALFWLGQKAGERSQAALGDATSGTDADTEVQTQAVFALSRRPNEESVPLLIKVAKTHKKAEVRKQAMFWLSKTGDERALEFFKEVLLK